MIKEIVKTIGFFLMGFVIYLGVKELLGPFDENAEMMFDGYYSQQEDTMDAVFIGNSHIYKFWQGAFAWDELGMASSNLATSAMPASAMKNVMIEALKTQSPKVVVLDATPFASEDKSLERKNNKIHLLLDNMKFSWNRVEMIENYCKFSEVSGMDKLQYYFPIMQFHPRWKELSKTDFLKTHPSYLNSNYQKSWMSKGLEEDTPHTITEERQKVGELNEAALRDLLEWCKGQEVEVLFVAMPILRTVNLARINYVGDIIEEAGFAFVNCNDKEWYDSFGFQEKDDFQDVNHTNIKGSYKFTTVFGEYLMEQYGLEDHRGEDKYASYEEEALGYRKKVKKYFKY